MAPFVGTVEGNHLSVIVEDQPAPVDMDKTARAKKPVYVKLHALAGEVDDPRAVAKFVEIVVTPRDGLPDNITATGRSYAVIRFLEKSPDAVQHTWECEAARLKYKSDLPEHADKAAIKTPRSDWLSKMLLKF
jgi:hypothetical protein